MRRRRVSVETPERRRRRRIFGVFSLGLAAVLVPGGVLLRDASGPLQAVSLATLGYGVGLLFSGVCLLAGRDALGRRRK